MAKVSEEDEVIGGRRFVRRKLGNEACRRSLKKTMKMTKTPSLQFPLNKQTKKWGHVLT